jgi:hypothetical protein
VHQEGRIALMIGVAQLAKTKALAADVEWNEPVAVPGGHSRILLIGAKTVKVDK